MRFIRAFLHFVYIHKPSIPCKYHVKYFLRNTPLFSALVAPFPAGIGGCQAGAVDIAGFVPEYSVQERAMPEPGGVLATGYGDIHDSRQRLFPELRFLWGVVGCAYAA